MERLKQLTLLSFRSRILLVTFFGSLLLHPACSRKPAKPEAEHSLTPQQTSPQQAFSLPQAEDGQWMMPAN